MTEQLNSARKVNTKTSIPVRVDFNTLISDTYQEDVAESMIQAFGLDGFGALVITDIPKFKETREKALNNIYQLSKEPQEVLDALLHPNPSSLYEIGWNVKKMNAAFGKSSNKFASFFSRYPHEKAIFPEDPIFEKENQNIWPSTIPQFKQGLDALNLLLNPPLLGLLKYFDKYLLNCITEYQQNKLFNSFFNHYSCVNRLIIYNPLDIFNQNKDDLYNWDNWHTDFGLLTTIAHPIYFDEQGEPYELDRTSFYLQDRHGHQHEAIFSEDEFLVIIGDAMFIESAGYLPPTPHTVKIEKGMPTDIYRIQSVSFFEPYFNHRMYIPNQETLHQIIERDPCKHKYRGTTHFKEGCYYKEFIDDLLIFLYK